MKNIIIFLFIFILLINISCDKIITDVEAEYVENIVVDGVLTAGELIKDIRITKTIPPLELLSIEKVIIPDAEVTIYSNSMEFRLHHTKDGYYDSDNIIAKPETGYDLLVSWHGKKVYSHTYIPSYPNITNIQRDSIADNKWGRNGFSIIYSAEFQYFKNFAYIAGYLLININSNVDSTKYDTVRYFVYSEDIFAPSTNDYHPISIKIYQKFIPSSAGQYYYDPFRNNRAYCLVEAYDPKFYNFWKTRKNGSMTFDMFSFSSGKNIDWNVSGDGFGLFIGRAVSMMKVNK